MAKGNMFLGFARGKVGDVVFTRSDGEQLSRVRNRSPKNPRTPRQGVQRSILKTVSQAYSVFKPIADHSFEGYATGTPNQSRFAQLNNDYLRTQVVNNVNLSDDEQILSATIANYSPHIVSQPLLNPYQISEGSLAKLNWRLSSGGFLQLVYRQNPPTGDITYGNLVTALQVERGDQLTFVWAFVDDKNVDNAGLIVGVEFSRVILEPASGDMSARFINMTTGAVNDPNPANSGPIWFDQGEVGYLDFGYKAGTSVAVGGERVLGGFAVILSRKFGSVWRRSSQVLDLSIADTLDNDHLSAWPLGDAVRSFLNPEVGSSLYLNQAQPIVTP